MVSTPSVSILMPVRNVDKYIIPCIQSIESQSYDDWELVIVDDHSTDKTSSILQALATRNRRIRIESHPGTGILNALQTGVKFCSGKYFTRMDGDDLMPPGRLDRMVQVLENSPAKTIVTGLVSFFGEDLISEGLKRYESWLNNVNITGQQWENIYRECIISSPNWMGRRKELLAMGGYSELEYPEDYHLAHRWYQNGFRVECLPEVTLLWREHSERTSSNSKNYAQEAFFNLKISEFLHFDDKQENLILWGTGRKGKLTARILDDHLRDFIWMGMNTRKHQIDRHPIIPYKEIKNYLPCQLLISVYPDYTARINIKQYLHKFNLIEGKNYWFL